MAVITISIIGQTCSACTKPYNSSSSYELSEEMGLTYSLPRKDFGVVPKVERQMSMYFQSSHPLQNSSYRKRTHVPIKNRRSKKSGIYTRKYHYIIQRGGADCSQRR